MSYTHKSIIAAAILCVGGCVSSGTKAPEPSASALSYPDTRRGSVTDDYHGTVVADPYRWLEGDVREKAEVAQWVVDQNRVTQQYLQSMPERKQIEKRMTQLWDYAKVGIPVKKGERYFVRRNTGLQNQSPVYMMRSLNGAERVVIDPNTWSDDGTVALADVNYSPKGNYIAYGIQTSGSDWRTGKVLDVNSGELLSEELLGAKYGFGAEWLNDESGFYYSRFPIPESGADFQSLNHYAKVYYHKLGTPQSQDKVVFENADKPKWSFYPQLTDDNRYLLIYTGVGTDDNNRVDYFDLERSPDKSVPLITNFDAAWYLVHSQGNKLYFVTSDNAPLRRVVMIDVTRPSREHWQEIIPEQELSLKDVSVVGGRFIASYLKDAATEIRRYTLVGKPDGIVQLPGVGTAYGFSGKADNAETFFAFSSYVRPTSVFRYDVNRDKTQLWQQPKLAFNPDNYVSKQVFYTSKDGTKIPMIISHKKGLIINRKTPTLLYGYGGFNISIRPFFKVANFTWMDMGGVYAVANIRGGGEYGERWHKAGTKLNKQNVFDDFIAAAEYLIDEGQTSPEHLAVYGRSNGGLLVGATINQRPDLFAAALPTVGVMDMLRFDQFTAGRYWVDDYGSSSNADEFQALYAYSPYHNTGDKPYPAVLVNTADTDDRVVPGHSFKYIAAMQHDYKGDKPMLIRIESKAGHGSGKPTHKQIEEYADMWAFIAKHTGLVLPANYGK